MINFLNMLIALNKKGAAVGAALNIDVCYAGRTLLGEIYNPEPDVNYIKFDLIPNEVERETLANGRAEVMRNGIYQATVYVGKSGKANPDIESAGIVDGIRQEFIQGLKLTEGGQSCEVFKTEPSPPLPNETHHTVAVSVYFNCIA